MILSFDQRLEVTKAVAEGPEDSYGRQAERTETAVYPCKAYRPSRGTYEAQSLDQIAQVDVIEVLVRKDAVASTGDGVKVTDRRSRVIYEGYKIISRQTRDSWDVLAARRSS